jgi:hypothetical protein
MQQITTALLKTGVWKWVKTSHNIDVLVNAPAVDDDPRIEVVTGLLFKHQRIFVVELGRNTLDTLWVKMSAKNLHSAFASFSILNVNQQDSMLYVGNRIIASYLEKDVKIDEHDRLIYTPTNHTLWKPN